MMLLKKVILDLNITFGKIFYKCHSGLYKSLRDSVKIIFSRGVSLRSWTISSGVVEVGELVINYTANKGGFTNSYIFEDIPDVFREIVMRNIIPITKYLGKDFTYETPTAWVNKELPDWARNYDIYSNVWHMDSHDGFRLLKIFINVNDTSPQDGPLVYLSRENSVKYFYDLWDRWTFENLRKGLPRIFIEELRFCSNAGGYLIINTANCFHRASSPQAQGVRPILQMILYPKWVKNELDVRATFPVRDF